MLLVPISLKIEFYFHFYVFERFNKLHLRILINFYEMRSSVTSTTLRKVSECESETALESFIY